VSSWAYLDHAGPIPFAHRGGASEHPENTMPAFEHAVTLGYRYLETDAHATADGVLVAFHDNVLDRVTDRTGAIADLPWETVRQARLGDAGIPLMEDLLTAWPDVRVNIDLKHEATTGSAQRRSPASASTASAGSPGSGSAPPSPRPRSSACGSAASACPPAGSRGRAPRCRSVRARC